MPNHVKNILTIEVAPKNVGKIFTEEEYAAMAHRPTTAEEEVEAVLDFIAQTDEKYAEPKRGTIDFEKIVPMPEGIFRGNLDLKERRLYGENNWYDWSVKHWGTKWNAYDFESNEYYPNPIIFSTAWSAPYEIYEALAKKFPNLKFSVQYADEDMGNNCGEITYENGEFHDWEPGSDKEGMEFACQVWYGTSPDNCGYVYNKKTHTWEYADWAE